MTDTELILSRLDDMKADITDLREEMHVEMAGLREEMHGEIAGLKAEMSDMRSELGGKIEAVRLAVVNLRDRMDTLEFALQTEISKTYDLAQENAKKLSRLLLYKDKIVPMPVC